MDMNLLRRFKYWCIRNYYSLFKKDKIHKIKLFGYNPELGDVYKHQAMKSSGEFLMVYFKYVGRGKFTIIDYKYE
jgi:hypothetical protein